MTYPSTDALELRARRVAQEEKFTIDFPPEVFAEINALKQFPVPADKSIKDLRSLAWSSIDNAQSRDLDQVEWAEKLENGDIHILVGIADVDHLVAKNSACDKHARANAITLYTGVKTFPMLPEELSTDLTSLGAGAERSAIVIDFIVCESGDVRGENVYPALIHNKAKLSYDQVGLWLQGKAASPSENCPEIIISQLRLQNEASERLTNFRQEQGALTLGGVEVVPLIVEKEIHGFAIREPNPARDVIESFMVAANVVMAGFLLSKGAFCLRRVVRTPKRWDRIQAIAAEHGETLPSEPDSKALSEFLARMKRENLEGFPELSLAILKSLGPGEYIVEHPGTEHEGHFGLAVHHYTHSTAPNRRYADLVTQRLLKCAIGNQPCVYDQAELSEIAAHCTERDQAARHVERLMKKILAATMLRDRLGEIFDGIITGVGSKGTFVRLKTFPAEGRIVNGAEGLDVGEKVQVRLVGTNSEKGFIDFESRGARR